MKTSTIDSIKSWNFDPNVDYSDFPLTERSSWIQEIGNLVRSWSLSSNRGMEYRYALEKYTSDLLPPDISPIIRNKKWKTLTIHDLCAWSGDPTKALQNTLTDTWYNSRIIAIERSRTLVEQMKKTLGALEVFDLTETSEQYEGKFEVICANSLDFLVSMKTKVDVIMMNYALDRLPQRILLELIKSRSDAALFVNCVPLQYSSPKGAITYVSEADRLIPEGSDDLDALWSYFQRSVQSSGKNSVTTLQDGREDFAWASIAWVF